MAKLTYSEQLRHPNWQRKRLEKFNEAGFECENCGDKDTTLNVHHKRYVKGRMAWEYELCELAVLCEPCHKWDHENTELLQWVMCEAGVGAASTAGPLIAGFYDASCAIDPGVGEMGRQTDIRSYEIGIAAAILDWMGCDAWRSIVRGYAKDRPTTPAIDAVIARWDEQSKEQSETNGRA